jgi:tetratricopeptide (TPR) repeat protein
MPLPLRRWSSANGACASAVLTILALSLLPITGEAAPPPSPSSAAPRPSSTERKRLAAEAKARGDEAINTLRFAEALAAYDEAFALEPSPALAYNRGRALQLLDRMPEALDAFEQFQREAPPELLLKVPKFDDLVAEVRSKVATLAMTAEPEGVEVLVDGRTVGTSPFAAPIRLNRKGNVLVELRKEGHHPIERRLDFTVRAEQALTLTLQPKDTTALLVVKSSIPGASVRVDQRKAGNAPSESYLPPGAHRVLVAREGYDDAEFNVVLAKGERKAVDVALKPSTPLYKRWWFWTAIGAGVVTGVTLGVVLNTEREAGRGTIEPGQISAPLVTF